MKFSMILLTILSIYLMSVTVHGDADNEKVKILAVVNNFFKVLETGDTELAKEILVNEGSNFSLREKGEAFDIRFTPYDSLIKSLPKIKGKYKEVITNPEFLIHRSIAVVWARYKFYIDGKFSHCGVDSFSLIRDKDKWKIASIIYTVEKSGCDQGL